MKKSVLKRKIFTQSISFLLSVLLVFYAIPTIIYAELADFSAALSDGEIPFSEESEADIYSYTGVAYEVESAREINTKHFRLEDGTYVAAQYDYAVHYVDENGALQDINNRLSDASGGVFANPDSRIKFAKKINGNKSLFELHEHNTKITLSLNDANKGTKGVVKNYNDSAEETILQKMMNLENIASKILYADILDGVDIEYIAQSNNIKENIIVKEKSDKYSYTFTLTLNGLTARLCDSGDVEIINEKSGDVQYIIPAPVVYDAKDEYAPFDVACYTLEDLKNGKYYLTVTVSAEWMNAEERAFPVTVDPALVASSAYVMDTSISSGSPSSSYPHETNLYISEYRMIHWQTLMLPTIPYSSAYITNATIRMRNSITNSNYVAVYQVLTVWDEDLTWNQYTDESNPKGKIDSTIIDYNVLRSGFYSWNITSLAKKWYDGTVPNYGVAFDSAPGQTANVSFYSSDNSIVDSRPALTINYRDIKGVEEYWSYSSQSAGA